jgi:hypothetical protein
MTRVDPAMSTADLSTSEFQDLYQRLKRTFRWGEAAMWYAEAGKYDVFPVDGSAAERLMTERPQIAEPRTQYVFRPGTQTLSPPAVAGLTVSAARPPVPCLDLVWAWPGWACGG